MAFHIRNSKPLSHFSKWKKEVLENFTTTCAKARLWLSRGSADGGPSHWPPAGPQFHSQLETGLSCGAALPAFLYQRLQTPALLQELAPLSETGYLLVFFPSFSFSHFFFFFLIYPASEGKGCSGIWSSVFLTPSPVGPSLSQPLSISKTDPLPSSFIYCYSPQSSAVSSFLSLVPQVQTLLSN